MTRKRAMTDGSVANLMDMPLAKLAVLSEILNERSVSAAARKFGLSQSSVSNTLARFRIVFGDDLVVWGRPSPVLTERGRTLSRQLELACAECANLSLRREFDPQAHTASFKIIASDYTALALAPLILPRLRATAPRFQLTIDLLNNQSPDHFGAMDQYDLYMAWLRDPPSSWYTRVLFGDEFVVIASAENDDVFDGMEASALFGMKHVAIEPQNPHNQGLMDKELREGGWRRDVAVWASSSSVVPSIVGQSDLVAFLPEGLARYLEKGSGIKIVPSPVKLRGVRYSLMWPQRMQQDPAHRWFRNLILDAVATLRQSRSSALQGPDPQDLQVVGPNSEPVRFSQADLL